MSSEITRLEYRGEKSRSLADDNLSAIVLQKLSLKLHTLYLESSPLVHSVHREVARERGRRRSLANDAKSGEQNVFSEIHTIHTLRAAQKA